jgi:hypothetical protein
MLYQRNASTAPTTAKQKAAISIWFCDMAITPYEKNAVVKRPPESPSMPSITEVENIIIVAKIIIGIIKMPT